MRDQVKNALRRVHSAELHNTTVEVFEPTTTFEQGDGWSVSYPDTSSAVYDARVDSPSADADRERSGTSAEIDVIVRVRDDTGQQWTCWGEETEAPVRLRIDGTVYEVQNVPPTNDGLTKLEATEV